MTLIARKPAKLIYLSSPYSNPDETVRHERYRWAMLTVTHYLHQGIYLYSPILHNHPITCYDDLGSAEEWLEFDYVILDRCDEMWVLCIEGWESSLGISAEIAYCNTRGIKVRHIDPHVDQIPEGFIDFGGPNARK